MEIQTNQVNEKKYEFTGETIIIDSRQIFKGRHPYEVISRFDKVPVIVKQIRAIKDFGDVKAGDIGGWIETEENLSQNGRCWVGPNSYVIDNAIVGENAIINDRCLIMHNVTVRGESDLNGRITICDNAIITDNAKISGTVIITGQTYISNNGVINGANHKVHKDSSLRAGVWFSGKISIRGNASIKDHVHLSGSIRVAEDAILEGLTVINANGVYIGTGAHLKESHDLIYFGPMINFIGFAITAYKTQNGSVRINYGSERSNKTIQEVLENLSEKESKRKTEIKLLVDIIKNRFNIE